MKILGIDPGIGRCGWAIIETQNAKFKALDYGCIETSPKKQVEERLEEIFKEISNIIKIHKPQELSIEDLFFGSNAKTAFAVGQARGVVLLCASQNNLEVAVYNPLQVKIAITGYGRAQKNQMGQMVKTIFGLTSIPRPDDTADALAIALTHAFNSKLAKLSK